MNTLTFLADVQPTCSMAISPSKTSFQANKHQIKSETPEFDKYRPYFGWVNADTIRNTFKHTIQWGASVFTFPMKRHLKSRNPALNVNRKTPKALNRVTKSHTMLVQDSFLGSLLV